MTQPFRWRRCGRCGLIRPAGEFRLTDGPLVRGQDCRRTCPECNFTAPTSAFQIARERLIEQRERVAARLATRQPWWAR